VLAPLTSSKLWDQNSAVRSLSHVVENPSQ